MLEGIIIYLLYTSIRSLSRAKKDPLDQKTANEFAKINGRAMTEEDVAGERERLRIEGKKGLRNALIAFIIYIIIVALVYPI